MKKHDILSLICPLITPVVLILLGLVLMFSPDSASALIAKVLGWGVVAAGAGFGIAAIIDRRGTAGKVLSAILCVSAGSWLLRHPLLLAAGIGRFIGILLLLRGGRDLFQSASRGGKILAAIVAVLGIVLIVLPMTTSRVVFSLCGVVLLIVGIAMLAERLRERRYLDGGDSNIIDAL